MGRSIGQLKYEAVNNFDLLADPSINSPTYIGLAEPGSATDAPVWQISKLVADSLKNPDQNLPTDDAGLDVPSDDFKFKWEDRADYFA